MLSSRHVRLLSKTRLHRSAQRTFVTESLQTLVNGYLDLAVALPFPAHWPVYSSTIITIGLVSRISLFPLAIWARRREQRLESNVIPYLKAYRAKLDERVKEEIRKKNTREARIFYHNSAREKLLAKRDELYKTERCTPWVTLVVPALIQTPIFIGLSAVFLRAANEPGSVLRNESFFSFSSLAHADTTMAIPVALGIISLATTETSRWFMTEDRARKLAEAKQKQEQQSTGKIVVNPLKHIKSIMRGLSVARILIAATLPGSVELYWLTSAGFGLFQNWFLNYLGQFGNKPSPSPNVTKPVES